MCRFFNRNYTVTCSAWGFIEMKTDKAALRRQQLDLLRGHDAEERRAWSGEIMEHLQGWEVYQQARCVLLYAPMRNEPDLLGLLAGREEKILPNLAKKKWYFPKVHASGLSLHEVHDVQHLQSSTSILREPNPSLCPVVEAGEIDLAILPGLAFDPMTYLRLGRGGGYYDRLLAQPEFRARTVGVCFPGQLKDGLPRENHDVPLHAVVTPKGIIGK